MKRTLFFLLVAFLVFCKAGFSEEKSKLNNTGIKNMKIKLKFEDKELTAVMQDSPTTRDFISLLPLTLNLEDYARTEKISQLPKRLSLKDAPSGYSGKKGDITYYSPWGNLAIFYKDSIPANGLILLGHIEGNVNIIESWKGVKSVLIELDHSNK